MNQKSPEIKLRWKLELLCFLLHYNCSWKQYKAGNSRYPCSIFYLGDLFKCTLKMGLSSSFGIIRLAALIFVYKSKVKDII